MVLFPSKSKHSISTLSFPLESIWCSIIIHLHDEWEQKITGNIIRIEGWILKKEKWRAHKRSNEIWIWQHHCFWKHRKFLLMISKGISHLLVIKCFTTIFNCSSWLGCEENTQMMYIWRWKAVKVRWKIWRWPLSMLDGIIVWNQILVMGTFVIC